MQKRPAAKTVKGQIRIAGTAADPRHNGLWVWLAVTVGKGQQRYTHEEGTKRVTFFILPKPQDAPSGKPRGLESIAHVLETRINKGSHLVFDGWKASEAAAKRLGYRCAPPVRHEEVTEVLRQLSRK